MFDFISFFQFPSQKVTNSFDLDRPWGTPSVAVIIVEVFTYSTITYLYLNLPGVKSL